MKTRVTARDRAAFALKACEAILRAGGRFRPDDTGLYSWSIPDTRCGALFLQVHTGENCGLGFIAGRFVFPGRAVAVLGVDAVNRFSGKWNHHYWGTNSVDEAASDFEWSLQRVVGDTIQGTGFAVTDGGAE